MGDDVMWCNDVRSLAVGVIHHDNLSEGKMITQ